MTTDQTIIFTHKIVGVIACSVTLKANEKCLLVASQNDDTFSKGFLRNFLLSVPMVVI